MLCGPANLPRSERAFGQEASRQKRPNTNAADLSSMLAVSDQNIFALNLNRTYLNPHRTFSCLYLFQAVVPFMRLHSSNIC